MYKLSLTKTVTASASIFWIILGKFETIMVLLFASLTLISIIKTILLRKNINEHWL